jgi:hypothetical protein
VLGVHSEEAAWLLEQYGDVIYIDATHGVNNLRCPNLAVLVVDSHNHGHLVAMFVLMHEAEADVEIALQSLRDFAPSWMRGAAVIDKSDVLRVAIKCV